MLLSHLNRFPPFLCRLMAREGRGKSVRALSLDDLVARSGLNRATVSILSRQRSWPPHTSLLVVEKFTAACGVDLFHLRRNIYNLKHKRLSHLQRNPKYYKNLLTQK